MWIFNILVYARSLGDRCLSRIYTHIAEPFYAIARIETSIRSPTPRSCTLCCTVPYRDSAAEEGGKKSQALCDSTSQQFKNHLYNPSPRKQCCECVINFIKLFVVVFFTFEINLEKL